MKSRTKGVLMAIGAAFFYAMIAATVKWIGSGMPPFEKFFFRSAFGFVLICVIMSRQRLPFRPVNQAMLVLRGVTGLIAGIAYYVAVSAAPLAEVITLSNIFPFMVVILSAFFFKEKIRSYHLAALALSFAGVLLVMRPGFADVNIYYIIASFSAVFTAFAYICLKQARKTDTSEMVVFYFSLIGMLGCLPFMLAGNFIMPTAFQLFQLVILGLNATAYQLLVSGAYKYAPAGELSIYSYTTIVFSAAIGMLFFGEYPALATVIGITAILVGAYIIFRREKAAPGLPD